jgi:UPF0755 protein
MVKRLLVAALLATAAATAWLSWFASAPVTLPHTPYEFTVHPGSSLKSVARGLAFEGVLSEGESFWILGRILGKAKAVQAGTYRLDQPLTPLELLDKLARGDVLMLEMVFVEGTTMRQWLAQLSAQPRVRHTLAGRTDKELRALFGTGDEALEGWFFPDTYRFSPGAADTDVLKRAHGAMKKRLADAWAGRDQGLPLKTSYEALILASIVEKETAVAAERPRVAAVFMSRLKLPMRLQTDPTVIYGMGESFDGNIRKKDLTADTPWNTYTRDGLPPTPIAMPGAASIAAVMHPAPGDDLYFVARGDGSHQFSRTLEEHNRAVARYQLGR